MGNSGYIVAVVDDSSMERQTISRALKDNFAVRLVPSGISLLGSYDKLKPDIIVLDMYMPYATGAEVLKEIFDKDKKVKVIFYTSAPKNCYENVLSEYPIAGFIQKPVSAAKLLQIVQDVAATIR